MPVCGCCRFTVVYCLSAFSSAGDSKDSTEMGQYLLHFGYKICVKLMLNRSPTLVSSKSLVCITQWLQYYESTWNRLRTALLLDVTYFSHCTCCVLSTFYKRIYDDDDRLLFDCNSTALRLFDSTTYIRPYRVIDIRLLFIFQQASSVCRNKWLGDYL